MDTLREQYETGQEGWRAAIAERSRRELAEREAAMRDKLARERDEEIEVWGGGGECGVRSAALASRGFLECLGGGTKTFTLPTSWCNVATPRNTLPVGAMGPWSLGPQP